MKIEINTIPHHDQRYPTCGDWILDPEKRQLTINVSEVDNWKMEFLVGFHEMIEAVLCLDREITTAQVDQFDLAFEAQRSVGDDSEPGDHPDAPYRKEHFFATSLERLMAAELGVDWQQYENRLYELE